jgi:predicted MFS family arabinose efflux permease
METISPQEMESRVAARYMTLLILWFAMLMSVTIFFCIAWIVGGQGTPNPVMSYALLAGGFSIVAVSFVLKQQLARKAIDNTDIAALQKAHVVAWALSESAALLGLLDRLTTASQTSWFLFAIAALGILLHFPKKDHVRAASSK